MTNWTRLETLLLEAQHELAGSSGSEEAAIYQRLQVSLLTIRRQRDPDYLAAKQKWMARESDIMEIHVTEREANKASRRKLAGLFGYEWMKKSRV